LPVVTGRPIALLLLPRELEGFILREQAQDLLQAPGVLAVEPSRLPYGALARMPEGVREHLARTQARRLLKGLRKAAKRGRGGAALAGTAADDVAVGVVVIFHAVQEPLARELVRQAGGDCELWYGRWDRYEAAYDAGERLRATLAAMHERAATLSALTFVASVELERQEREDGREAVLVGLSAGDFPALDPSPLDAGSAEVAAFGPEVAGALADGEIVAFSLGHLGRRTDWALVRGMCERLPGLRLLFVGAWHDDEIPGDADYAWARASPQITWLGRRSDEEAATLLRAVDVGIVPFRVEPFNDAGLPYRILKYAKLGRRTVCPDLAGVRTWPEAVDVAADVDAFAAALSRYAGARSEPDLELRAWALAQTPWKVNRPLWERLRERGVDTGGR